MFRTFPLADRVAQHAAGFTGGSEATLAPPRPAATVALVRDGDAGPEVFLMRRRPSMAFAASMHVFPGGGLDPRDDETLPWHAPAPDGPATPLVCAAVRELFEECGVLLAGSSADGALVTPDLADPTWEQDRVALVERRLGLADLVRRRGLALRGDLLVPWARWRTPLFEPRRFDAWFFLAALPPGQRAVDVGGEADHAQWVPAAQAADDGAAGVLAMLPPTLVTVQEIAAAPTVAALLAQPRRVRAVMPWLVRSASGTSIGVDLDGCGGGEPGPASGIEEAR